MSGHVGADGTYAAQSSATDLLSQLTGPGSEAIRTIDFTTKLSFEVSLQEWLDLIERLRMWNDDSAISGIVVTQGTALLEEIPFLARLFVRTTKPIVFTGAMKPASQRGSDAQMNLLDAITVASAREAAGYGPLVVMDRKVIEAAGVHKAHKSSPAAFEAVEAGLVGNVDTAGVQWLRPPSPAPNVFARIGLATPVPLLKIVVGFGPDDLSLMVADKPAGLVVEGFPGGGGVPADCAE